MKNKLKEIRFFRKMRQTDLSRISGIRASRISEFENEAVEPKQDEMEKFAKVLKLTVGEIFPT